MRKSLTFPITWDTANGDELFDCVMSISCKLAQNERHIRGVEVADIAMEAWLKVHTYLQKRHTISHVSFLVQVVKNARMDAIRVAEKHRRRLITIDNYPGVLNSKKIDYIIETVPDPVRTEFVHEFQQLLRTLQWVAPMVYLRYGLPGLRNATCALRLGWTLPKWKTALLREKRFLMPYESAWLASPVVFERIITKYVTHSQIWEVFQEYFPKNDREIVEFAARQYAREKIIDAQVSYSAKEKYSQFLEEVERNLSRATSGSDFE